jgi:hypothetical protein
MPPVTIETVLPPTVQTADVAEAKLTPRPELAVAPTANGAAPKVTALSAPNAIVCDAGLTVKLRVTGVAGAKLALPAWLAVIEQDPPPTIVTVVPETVQTEGVVEAKLTARPELAVAPTVNAEAPYVASLSGSNVIVCGGKGGIKTVLAEPMPVMGTMVSTRESGSTQDALAPVMVTE